MLVRSKLVLIALTIILVTVIEAVLQNSLPVKVIGIRAQFFIFFFWGGGS